MASSYRQIMLENLKVFLIITIAMTVLAVTFWFARSGVR